MNIIKCLLLVTVLFVSACSYGGAGVGVGGSSNSSIGIGVGGGVSF